MEKCTLCNASQINYAKNLSKNEHDEVKKTSTLIKVDKGDTIFLEDEKLQSLYCIQEGVCKFSKVDDNGKEHIVKLLGKGELMGRSSVISNKGAAVSAKAVTDAVLCQVGKKLFLQCLTKNNVFCIDVLKGFITDQKNDEASTKIFCSRKKIKNRLAGLLCYLLDRFGTTENGSLTARLKREDMATILGTSSEYVINILQQFKSQRLIRIHKREIFIVSRNGLLSVSNN
ncbi:Crp/Fnr family transcriptional regulator [Costertonia aggregata]|uniref:Crp/Fnr family transcriptional regulator n=1 Tax=Costertonia aggregata TaxID=343403 RepID=A0A7H9ARA9_9FLAO|nr:Crp/Fnr family transcriptional regulator [Costertonia aggregata]QLG45970.1 Crp/Fnr family transcriptional regulator [Costertonia aggregata]